MDLQRQLAIAQRRFDRLVPIVDPPTLSLVVTKEGEPVPEIGPWDLHIVVEQKEAAH